MTCGELVWAALGCDTPGRMAVTYERPEPIYEGNG